MFEALLDWSQRLEGIRQNTTLKNLLEAGEISESDKDLVEAAYKKFGGFRWGKRLKRFDGFSPRAPQVQDFGPHTKRVRKVIKLNSCGKTTVFIGCLKFHNRVCENCVAT